MNVFYLTMLIATEEAHHNMKARKKMKIEDFDEFKDIPIDEIDECELVDIRTLEIRTDLPPKERMEDVLKKTKKVIMEPGNKSSNMMPILPLK